MGSKRSAREVAGTCQAGARHVPGTSLARAGHLPGYHLPVAVSAAGVAAIVFIFFLQTIGFPFLNWDDADIFVHNPALHAPGFIRWAFTTTYVEHFQPGAWLVWGAVDRAWGLTPTAAHSITVVLHTACAALVLLLGERLGLDRAARVIGALLFALHPLRVEVVAWASAMPYSLALLFALLSTLIFLEPQRTALLTTTSVALFAASLLARPVAFGLPVVLWVLDVRRNRVRRLTPFVVLAVGAVFLESRARVTATFAEVGAGARFTLACTAPFKYLWRTIVPVKLTPLDPLALTPRGDLPLALASAAALGTLTWIAWRWRREFPRSFAAWISYLALLLPAVGLV